MDDPAFDRGTRPKAGSSILNANRYKEEPELFP
jgi:hypothetical protein